MHSVATQVNVIAIGYAVLVTLVALVLTVRRAERPTWLDSMAWMLELLVALRALIGFGKLLDGDRPESVSTYVGYLVASVCVLPIALRSVADDRGPWSTAVVAVAALAVTVIGVRVQMTAS